MDKKKLTLTFLSVALICTLAVAGTLAYLKNSTATPVKNTFVAAEGLIDPDPTPDDTPENPYDNNGIFVLENEVTTKDDGSYEIADGAKEAVGNDYRVLPGVDLPKNPFVRVNGKNDIPAYLYIEVVDTLGEDSGLTYTIADDWMLLEGVTGVNDGEVYVLKSGSDPALVTADVTDVKIISGDTITVAETLNIPENAELSFYGYLGQASAGEDAAEVFTNCFIPTT